MDSKLRRTAILASMAVILLTSLLVLYSSWREGSGSENNGYGISSQSTPSQENQGGEEGGLAQQETGTDSEQSSGQIGDDLSAFLRDETFFDQEINPILEAARNQANRLSLVVTSVEKDLRIQIVDTEGQLVEGESFFVKLDGEDEYKDLDQDGVIYIGGLAAGEYYVELLPLEGYRVPVNETRVRVKDKVEYLAIDDISLLIKTEDEIDAEAEDSGVQDALEDADQTEIRELQATTGNTRVGIDVSKWNGEIDWDRVKNAGVEFAIVRAGYRGSVTGSLVEDPYFDANMKGAAASGVPTGVYFFTQAVNEVEAVEEASAVLDLVREYKIDYPIFIDTEGAGGNGRADGLDAETRTLVCEAFCRTIENAGYRAGVYASRNWYNENLDASRLEDYCIWLAEYRSVPIYQGYYQMWQYTSKGRIDGIQGNVDMNISYLGY
nr:glycoside hydrolase family 25 protein [uncultured Acetatifactor sp.]